MEVNDVDSDEPGEVATEVSGVGLDEREPAA